MFRCGMAEKPNAECVEQSLEQLDRERQGDEKSTEISRKRFNLRDELAEVKTLMEGTLSPTDKSTGVHKRYQLMARDYKRLEKRLVECQRKQLEVAQHRDIIQNEYARCNLAKSKLESLCRELQRHNKTVTEESKQRAREEEERRREVSAKFQSTINEITLKMQEHHQRNQSLQQENIELASKLDQLSEQYEAREEHFEKLLKQKQLELQLSEAKLAQQMVAAAEDKENSLAEKHYLLSETLEHQKRCEQLTRHEADLRGQLSLYSEKFEEFQRTLSKSNDVFTTFKKEMDKMSKTINTLEKEMLMWKTRYEKCNRSLLEMAEKRIAHEQTIRTLQSKTTKLEQLCRALQSERTALQNKLKSQTKDTPTEPPKETPPDKQPDTDDQQTSKETDRSDDSEETSSAETPDTHSTD